MYTDYEDYYEPSSLDMLLTEYNEKMQSILLDSIKNEITELKEENKKLKEKEKNFADRERAIVNKERDLEYKATNLKKEVETEFYKTTVSDNLQKFLDVVEV